MSIELDINQSLVLLQSYSLCIYNYIHIYYCLQISNCVSKGMHALVKLKQEMF